MSLVERKWREREREGVTLIPIEPSSYPDEGSWWTTSVN